MRFKDGIVRLVVIIKRGLGDCQPRRQHVEIILRLDISGPRTKGDSLRGDLWVTGGEIVNFPEPQHKVVDVKCRLCNI